MVRLRVAGSRRSDSGEGGEVPPLLSIAFFTSHLSPVSERLLEQARLRRNDILQKLSYLLLSLVLNSCTTANANTAEK